MKFKLFDFFKSVFRRFPAVSTLIISASIILLTLMEDPFDFSDTTMYALTLTVVGIYITSLWVLIVELLGESGDISSKSKWWGIAGALVLFGGLSYLFSYVTVLSFDTLSGGFTGDLYKLMALLLISIGAVFVVPFYKRDNSDLWSFVLGIFQSLLISGLYASVLALGLSLALGALDWFWSIKITDSQYMSVMVLSFPLVGLLHLVSGVPALLKKSKWEELPRFLEVFAKYIVIPLSGIYTVIMYPYIFSLPFRENWPPNQTTPTVLAFLALGYGALFILYKGLSDKKDRFTKIYSRVLGGISIPMVLFWMYSVYLRIGEYGLTVNRVVLMTFIVWALGVSIYFVAVKIPKMKWVFMSLLISMITVIYLPFTSFYWSQKAQVGRLIEMAKTEEIYEDGKIGREAAPESDSVATSMGETLSYLNSFNSLSGLEDIFDDEVLERLDLDDYGYADLSYLSAEVFFDEYSFKSGISNRESEFVSVEIREGDISIPEGFSSVQKITEYKYENDQVGRDFKVQECRFTIPKDFLDTLEGSIKEEYGALEASAEELTVSYGQEAILVITNISLAVEDGSVEGVTYVEGLLFTK